LKRLDQLLQGDRSAKRRGNRDGESQGYPKGDEQAARRTFGKP
jgi:hypothetical protein